MGGLGCAAIATGAAMKDAATRWQHATTEAASTHLVSFDTLRGVTENLFFVAFLCLGVYLAVLCVGVLTTAVFARWMGACAGAAGVLILLGNLLSLAFDAFVLVLAGFAFFLVAVVALGISLWRVDVPARGRAPRDRGRPVGGRS